MKRISILILLMVSLSAFSQVRRMGRYPIAHGYSTGTTWTNLVSWWKMTETSGGIAYDSHGSDDGTVYNATQTSGGVVFDGTDDSISISPDAFSTNDFTIIMRITPNSGAETMEQVLGVDDNQFGMKLYYSAGDFYVYVENINEENGYAVSTTMVLAAGVESMVAISRNGSSITVTVDDQGPEVETLDVDFTQGITAVGAKVWDPDWLASNDFTGTINNLCIFSDAKSDAYITAFYNSGSYTDYEDGDPYSSPTWTSLISWWKMTETSGGTAYDSHGLDNGTVTGATQTSSGIVCDGTDDYVSISTAAFGTSDFTVIMRVNPTSSSIYRNLIIGNTGSFWYAMYNNNRPRALITGGGGSSVTGISCNYGSVNMLGVVRSGSNFRFFINGSFENETYNPDYTGSLTFIGKAIGSYSAFLGTIRDVCIFSDAKADSYMTAFYNSGSYTDYEDGDPE